MPMKQGPPRPRPEAVARPVTNIESIRKVALKLIANFPGKLECATGVDGKTLILCQEKLSPKQKQWIKDEWNGLLTEATMDDIESIRKVALGPDDVVVVRCEGVTCDAEESLVRCDLERAFPENRVLVVRAGQSMSVVSPECADKREFKPKDSERWAKFMDGGWRTPEDGKPLPSSPQEKRSDGPLPSSVDRLKADEGAREQPKAGSAIEELLDACEVLKRQAPEYRTHVGENGYFVSDGQMNRLCQAAFVVQQRRDELPEPMDGHR